jgi:pantoate--beta-alanine ligase
VTLERTSDKKSARTMVLAWQREGLSVGLVPTMGGLHEGHLSLVRASVAECDRTVISIYVNPTQFAPGEDLDSYPRRTNDDCRLAEQNGVDLAFCPTDEVMYPDGFCTYVVQDRLTDVLEGRSRPTHFRGVLTVVCKLFHCLPADRAYFGHKDFQQTVVVRRMVRDLDLPVQIRVLPTVRGSDGLATSTRNERLNSEERTQALCLSSALRSARELYQDGQTDAEAVRAAMRRTILDAPMVRPDYVDIVHRETLEPVATITADAVAVVAARVGDARLIDNQPFGPIG